MRLGKVVIGFTLLLMLAAFFVFKNISVDQPSSNYQDPDQQYIAEQIINLPDGNTVSAEAETTNNHGWIGANLSELTQGIKSNLHYDDQYGVYVQDTLRNSPAQIAGLLPGDIITQINNISAEELLPTLTLIGSLQPGYTYPFTIFRHGEYLSYDITIQSKQNYS